MIKYRVGLLIILFICSAATGTYSQSCVSTNNNTIINFSCGLTCGTINLRVPDLRTTSNYTVTTIPYNPYPYTTPFGNELTTLYSDDVYSDKIALPFQFCFYDSVFSKLVVGSNGILTFDTLNANCFNGWNITPTIPYAFGTRCPSPGLQGNAYYPKASVMGAYSDLDPRNSPVSPADRKIEWRIEGSAPCRRFIASYYHVGIFGNNGCGNTNPNTFQIVIYESTAIIGVYFQQKVCLSSTNSGRGILGIQDWTQAKATAAAGKNATQWNAQNEAYQFIPSGGATRFINAQLFTMAGSLLATATPSFAIPGSIGLNFPNICPSGNSEQFVVRTSYNSCSGPNAVFMTEDTITINQTSSLSATTAATNLNCATGSTGSITVTVLPNSGVPPYQYSLNGGPLQNSNIFNGLSTGTYTVFATDINGCNSTSNVTVVKTGNLGVGYSSANSSCSGVNNGSITILPPSVYLPIQYSLNGGVPQSSNVFNGLAAGTYTVNVTDAIGCTGSTIITITQGTGVTATIATIPASCSGISNGMITVTPGGGNFPYQYSLNGGPSQSSNVFSGLAAGNYTIKVVDVNGCSATYPVNINPGIALNATISKTNVSCNGAANGTITVDVSTGTPPYQYSLDDVTWFTSNIFMGLTAGTYTVYYRDNNACTNSQSVIITQPAALNVTLISQAPRCFGYNDGSIVITASGGTGPYQYSLDNISWQGGGMFSGLVAGTYTVYCRDVNGCNIIKTVALTQPAVLTGTTVASDATCSGGIDGQIIATANGGTSPYGFSLGVPPVQSSNIFNVVPGTYNIMIVDANACVLNIPNIVVGLSNNLSVTASPDVTICEGKSTQLSVTSNATQFSWTQGSTLSNPNIHNPMANPKVTTQYIVTASSGLCSGKDTIVVNVNPAPIPNAGPDVEICYGQDYTLQGSGGVQFIWTPPSTLSNGALPNPLSTPPQTTTYSLNVIDSNGCVSLIPDPVIVTVTQPIIVKTNPPDTVVFSGDKFQLQASSGATNYSWSPSAGLSNPFIANPVLTVSTDVTFHVIASTPAGCRGDGKITVKVFKGPEIYMPTGFTPNGDGKNDIFKPFTVGIMNLNYFRVYNRWGQLIFSTAKLNDGWDGRIRGAGQPSGTYVWMVQGVTRDGKMITKKGTVTLIK
ncbi:MAG TPA: gliding motility-associated C-terminal domain-containing protein [Chitinophagaceae bacterium]|nr:gliding motility-associated C-terminal domain-containing protein [Chitinophagaceae bacterium]